MNGRSGTVTHTDPATGEVLRSWSSPDLATRARLTARYRRRPGFVALPAGLAYDEHRTVRGESWVERVTIVWEA